jgi:membrane protease YdiL (CAAX protease family)
MQMPNALGLFFLFYLLVALPYLAVRSASHLRNMRAAWGGPGARSPLTRTRAMASTLMMLGLSFWLAWLTGRTFDYQIFAVPQFGVREIGAGLVVLGMQFGLRRLLQMTRTEEEERAHPAIQLAPRTGGEWALTVVTTLAAGVAEESAYRGVGMSLLWWTIGSPWVAAPILAFAFALAHWVQRWKSMVTIFAMALLMQALVAFTRTLVIAMAVHAIYDIVAMYFISRKAIRYDREAQPNSPA